MPPAQDDRDSLSIQKVLDPLLKEHKRLSEPPREIPFLILPAFLGGDPYPEDVETRLRLRSAVLSALRAEAFVPRDSDHLRYFIFANNKREDVHFLSSGSNRTPWHPIQDGGLNFTSCFSG